MKEQHCYELLDNYLKSLPIAISTLVKDEIAKAVNVLFLPKGDTMFCGGKKKNLIYYILKGSCVRYVTNQAGIEKAIMFHTEDFIPEFGAPFTRRDESVVYSIVKASEDLYMFELDRITEQRLVSLDHAYAIHIINTRVEAIGNLNQFQNHLNGLSKADLLVWLLKEYSYIFQRFPSKDIANFMGVSPVWLSNLKRKITQ